MNTLYLKTKNVNTAIQLLFDKKFVYDKLIPYIIFFINNNLEYLKAIEIELDNHDKFIILFNKQNIRPFLLKYKNWLEEIEDYEQCIIMKNIFKQLEIC